MDPLSIAVSAVTLAQLATDVALKVRKYAREVSQYEADVARLDAELHSLAAVLRRLVALAEQAPAAMGPTMAILQGPGGPMDACRKEFVEIEAKMGAGETKWGRVRGKLVWPFTKAEVDEVLRRLERHKATMSLALEAQHSEVLVQVQDAALEMQRQMATLGLSDAKQQMRFIEQWLDAPDPSTSLDALGKSRQAGTGSWLVSSAAFARWKHEGPRTMWLTGIPGCGKSVLTSLVVDTLIVDSKDSKDTTVLYFFFDFHSPEKQKSEKMLRSLVTQLMHQRPQSASALSRLYNNRANIPRPDWIKCLLDMLEPSRTYHVIFDAIDECQDRKELLGLLETMSTEFPDSWHMFVSSRTERDIQERLTALEPEMVPLKGPELHNDIATFIAGRLKDDSKLSKWPDDVKKEIIDSLLQGSDDMFRWTTCQLDSLRKAIRLPMLRRILQTLPKSLDETYIRILEAIDDDYFDDACRLLKLLAVFATERTIQEAAEFIATDVDSDVFDTNNRFCDAWDLLELCGSLISVVDPPASSKESFQVIDKDGESAGTETAHSQETQQLRLAHYSVKEFLLSDRLEGHKAARYAFKIGQAHQLAAHLCLKYLHQVFTAGKLDKEWQSEYPALDYAADMALSHAKEAGQAHEPGKELILDLLDESGGMYPAFKRFVSPPGKEITVPGLWYASRYCLLTVAAEMLEAETDLDEVPDDDYCTILQAAVYNAEDNLDLVKLLLEAGADVNVKSKTRLGYALAYAAVNGNTALVELLLEHGACIDSCTQVCTALSAAASKDVALALIKAGADVNQQIPRYGSPLISSIFQGNVDVAKVLLDHGADPNSHSHTMSALGCAAYMGQAGIVRHLLKKGAVVNRDFETSGTPLLQCLLRNDLNEECLQILLDAGADPLFAGDSSPWGSVLNAACSAGRKDAVEMLLQKGASLSHRSPRGMSALHLAGHCSRTLLIPKISKGPKCNYEELMEFLIQQGLKVSDRDHGGHDALLNACVGGAPGVVRKILECGADVHSKDRFGWTGLHWAACSRSPETVNVLLQAGADTICLEERHEPLSSEGDETTDFQDRRPETMRPWEVAAYVGDTTLALLLNPSLEKDSPALRELKFKGTPNAANCELCRDYEPRGQYYKCGTCTDSIYTFCFRCRWDMDLADMHSSEHAVKTTEEDADAVY